MSCRRAILLPLVLLALLPSGSVAQGLYAEGSALEFRTDLPWARLELLGEEEIKGVSPLRIPGALDGDYWLRASGDFVETQYGRVRIRVDAEGSRIISYGRDPLKRTLLQSLYPGIPQYMTGSRLKGVTMGVTGFFAASTLVWAETEVWDSDRTVKEKERALDSADNALEQQIARTALAVAREEKSYSAERRNLALIATGVVWGVSLLDAALFRPDFRVTRADDVSLTLSMKPRSRTSAMFRSLVFPGLGQEYNAQPKKAYLMALGGIGIGSWLLRTQDRYNASVSEYERERIRYEGATLVEERNARAERLNVLFDETEDRKHARNIAAAVTAGYWAAGILEAAFSFGNPWGDEEPERSGFGFNVDPMRGMVVARMGF
jgi:hypothetical protein